MNPRIYDAARATLAACAAAGIEVPLSATLARVDAAREEHRAAALALTEAEDLLQASKAAWGADQTAARWSAVEEANAALARARLRADVSVETMHNAESAVEPELRSSLAIERDAYSEAFVRDATPLLAEYLECAAALVRASGALERAHSAMRARSDSYQGRAVEAGLAIAGEILPHELRLRLAPWELGGVAVAALFGGKEPQVLGGAFGAKDRLIFTSRHAGRVETKVVASALDLHRAAHPEFSTAATAPTAHDDPPRLESFMTPEAIELAERALATPEGRARVERLREEMRARWRAEDAAKARAAAPQ